MSNDTEPFMAALDEVRSERDEARAEIERLREALRRIRDHGETHDEPCWAIHNGDCADTMQEIARAALFLDAEVDPA